MKKQDKLQAILNFLNGELSFESKPKNYIVFQTNDVYNLDGINMSEDEFKAWQQENITDQDSLLIFQGQLAANSKDAVVKPAQPQPKVIEAAEQPKKRQRKRRRKKVSIEPIEPVEPELKTYGLMSEYGRTWRVSDRGLYEESITPFNN